MPCYKLGLRFGRDDILKRFLASGRTGLYVEAEELEGEGVAAAQATSRRVCDSHGVTVADITRVHAHEKDDVYTTQCLMLLFACLPPVVSISRSNCTSVGSPSWALNTAQRAPAEGDTYGCEGATGIHYSPVPGSRGHGLSRRPSRGLGS